MFKSSVRTRRVVTASPYPNLMAETQFRIQKAFSPSNSFLMFVPPPGYPSAVTCSKTLPIKLYFTADEKDFNLNVHYFVTS